MLTTLADELHYYSTTAVLPGLLPWSSTLHEANADVARRSRSWVSQACPFEEARHNCFFYANASRRAEVAAIKLWSERRIQELNAPSTATMLSLVGGRTLHFLGDSLMRQFASAFMCRMREHIVHDGTRWTLPHGLRHVGGVCPPLGNRGGDDSHGSEGKNRGGGFGGDLEHCLIGDSSCSIFSATHTRVSQRHHQRATGSSPRGQAYAQPHAISQNLTVCYHESTRGGWRATIDAIRRLEHSISSGDVVLFHSGHHTPTTAGPTAAVAAGAAGAAAFTHRASVSTVWSDTRARDELFEKAQRVGMHLIFQQARAMFLACSTVLLLPLAMLLLTLSLLWLPAL